MAKIINDGINPQVYQAICAKWYAGEGEDRFSSITGLQSPEKQFVLKERHDNEIEVPASNLVYVLYGSAMHEVLRKGAESLSNILSEKRLYWDFNGYRITGGYDAFEIALEDNTLTDHKFTTVSTWIYGDRFEDYTHQLNCYKLLCEKNGYPPITRLVIDFLFRDWSKMEMLRRREKSKKYPPLATIEEEMPLMSNSDIDQYIRDRIQIMKGALEMEDDEIPECEERWNDKRCLHYCDVNKWCHYYREKYA